MNNSNTPAGFGFSAQAAIGISPGDERGTSVPVSVSVNAVNDAPTVVLPGLSDQILTIGQNLTVPLGSVFTDIEGNPLSFTVQTNSNNSVPSAVIFKGSVDLTGLSSGTSTPTILADDGQGGTITGTFLISVGTVNPTPLQIGNTATLNCQNGLFELFVNVTNTTPYPINGFRLRVDSSDNFGGETLSWGYEKASQVGPSGLGSVDYTLTRSVANGTADEDGDGKMGVEVFAYLDMRAASIVPMLEKRGAT